MQDMNSGIQTQPDSEFRTMSMTPLFWKYTLSALAGFALVGVSVVADGFFVGNGVGAEGLATIGVIVPFWVITVALTGLFGIGGSTIAAIKLGNGDTDGARKVYGSTVAFALYLSVILSTIIMINLKNVLAGLGATDEIMPFALTYAVPFIIGAPSCVVGGIAYYFGRVDERPIASAIAYMVPSIICMGSEYYMIFVAKIGIAGSAISWILCAGLCILLIPYFHIVKATFRLKGIDFIKIDFKIVFESAKIGFTYFAIQVCTTIATIIINNQIIVYHGGAMKVAAFGIINAYIAYILTLISTAAIGGLQPVASYNTGAKLFNRVAELLKISSIQTTILLVAMVGTVFAFAEPIIRFFAGPNPELIAATKGIMFIFLLLYALGNLSQLAAGYFMAVERNGLAVLNGMTRVIIFSAPLFYILPHFIGIKGIWIAQPIADAMAFIVAVIFIVREYKRLKTIGDMKK